MSLFHKENIEVVEEKSVSLAEHILRIAFPIEKIERTENLLEEAGFQTVSKEEKAINLGYPKIRNKDIFNIDDLIWQIAILPLEDFSVIDSKDVIPEGSLREIIKAKKSNIFSHFRILFYGKTRHDPIVVGVIPNKGRGTRGDNWSIYIDESIGSDSSHYITSWGHDLDVNKFLSHE
jgi:hypothetical protein